MTRLRETTVLFVSLVFLETIPTLLTLKTHQGHWIWYEQVKLKPLWSWKVWTSHRLEVREGFCHGWLPSWTPTITHLHFCYAVKNHPRCDFSWVKEKKYVFDEKPHRHDLLGWNKNYLKNLSSREYFYAPAHAVFFRPVLILFFQSLNDGLKKDTREHRSCGNTSAYTESQCFHSTTLATVQFVYTTAQSFSLHLGSHSVSHRSVSNNQAATLLNLVNELDPCPFSAVTYTTASTPPPPI